jgi:hypothetical protein
MQLSVQGFPRPVAAEALAPGEVFVLAEDGPLGVSMRCTLAGSQSPFAILLTAKAPSGDAHPYVVSLEDVKRVAKFDGVLVVRVTSDGFVRKREPGPGTLTIDGEGEAFIRAATSKSDYGTHTISLRTGQAGNPVNPVLHLAAWALVLINEERETVLAKFERPRPQVDLGPEHLEVPNFGAV